MSELIANEFMRRRRKQIGEEGEAWPHIDGRIRVLIAERSRLLAETLMITLELEPSLEPIGYAREGSEVLELVEQLAPDVILVGTDLTGIEGLPLAALVREFWPQTSVVMLARTLVPDEIDAAYAAGAAGYVVHDCSADQLLDTITAACACHLPATRRRSDSPVSRIRNG